MENFIHGKGQAALNVCGCGRLHFTYGPITLHFEPDDFLAFGEAVIQMVDRFRRIRGAQLTRSTTTGHERVCH